MKAWQFFKHRRNAEGFRVFTNSSPPTAGGFAYLRSRRTALHPGDVAPEMLQAVSAPEKRGEVCRVHHEDVAGALAVRWQPEQAVELFVAGRSEGMRAVRVNGLTREQLHCFPVVVCQRIMRQVLMEAKRADILEQAL